MTQYSVAPVLTTPEIDDLLLQVQVADASGVLPTETGYVPTYDSAGLNRAAAEGYRWKAAKLAAEFDVSVGAGTSFKRSQKYQQLMDLASRYARKGGLASVPLGPGIYP